MRITEALDHLDKLASEFAKTCFADRPDWRLHVRPRGANHVSEVQLQVLGGTGDSASWFPVAHVNCSVGGASDRGLELVTYVNVTLCGRWTAYGGARARGITHLFFLADEFEAFTAGKMFEVSADPPA